MLASASVTAAESWSYTPITPVPVTAGTTYTVAVYLAGTGGFERRRVRPELPQLFGDILIEGSTIVDTSLDPAARPTNSDDVKMFGQADIAFVPTGP